MAQVVFRDAPLDTTAAWQERVQKMREQHKIERKVAKEAVKEQQKRANNTIAVATQPAHTTRTFSTRSFTTDTQPLQKSTSSPLWQERVCRVGDKYGIGHALLWAIIKTESNFNSKAVSPKGAQGLMQIMPNTARYLGLQDAFDPDANLDAGARYFALLLQEFVDIRLALAAYNAGPGAVRRYGTVPPYAETQQYVEKVLQWQQRYPQY